MFIDTDKYKIIIENTIVECVDLIILNWRWQILLWLRNNEPLKWVYYIPWWRRHKNEIIMSSIKRKAKEELWLDINENKILFLWIYDDIYPNSMFEWISSHYTSITYVYKIDDEIENNIRKDQQHSDLMFFDIWDPKLNDMIKLRIKDMQAKNII